MVHLCLFIFLISFNVIQGNPNLYMALQDLLYQLDDVWNAGSQRKCDLLHYGNLSSPWVNENKERQLVLRDKVPERISPLPDWYYDAGVIGRLSSCIIAIIRQKDQIKISEINSIIGIAHGVTKRNLGIIIGGNKPDGLETHSAVLHLEKSSTGDKVVVNLFCPNTTIQWKKYNVWSNKSGFVKGLVNPMKICPHQLMHNNIIITRL